MNSDINLTSIIIPTYNGLHLLKTCIESIRTYTSEPYEIIVVDNASTDGTSQYCIREKITFVSLPVNMGFPKACNLGLAAASGNRLLLLNNDVTVTANWLRNMTIALYSAADIGLVGPVTNEASGIQKVEIEFQNKAEFQQQAAVNNVSDPSRWREVKRVIGMCLLFTRDMMRNVGVLDEAFSPGHYEDDDYCYRIRAAGYRLIVCADVLVHHEGSASFKKHSTEDISELIDRNYRLFIHKWQVNPHQFIEEM
ncbi:glycosyltransferase family 2 protein [Paenibacillus pini]|uniref:Glycosyltransferase n=1 Tax=Paenibacillus pini JCM 16418 TaxID=1236976 RepID=W7Z2M0_9BACL|nr:glycosyltransferase family 2 protein [Paenibacillus pini]GAF08674.1 glycosyltransferase [Paenibacillus pini JCM 16418]